MKPLDEIAAGLTTVIAGALKQIFGDNIDRPVLGPITASDLEVMAGLILIFLLAHGLAAALLNRKASRPNRMRKN
jgi:hypothetical protein